MMVTEKDSIRMTYKINKGQKGEDSDPLNPLSRAATNLLDMGKPYIGHSIALFSMNTKRIFGKSAIRWLGVFVFTAGERIIFFPGFTEQTDWISTTSKGITYSPSKFEVDHLSLQSDWRSWHFTVRGSSKHKSGGKSFAVGNGSVLWFGLSLANEDVLRIVKRATLLGYEAPSTDSIRRVEIFSGMQKKASQHLVTPARQALKRFEPFFLHFTFCVSLKEAEDYQGDQWLLPIGSPRLKEPLPSPINNLHIRRHRISLADKFDIQITSMLVPGEITVPSIYSTWNKK